MLLIIVFTSPSLLGKFDYFNGKYLIIPSIIIIIYSAIRNIKLKVDYFELCIILQILYFTLLISFYEFNEVFTIFSLCLNLLIYRLIISNEKLTKEIANNYVIFMCLISLFSIVGLIGFYLNYFNHEQIIGLNVDRAIYLIGTTFTSESIWHDGIVRASGIYAEPGQFAVSLTFALIFAQFIRLKKIFQSLLLAGIISTMSMGGYFAIFILIISTLKLRLVIALALTLALMLLLYQYLLSPIAPVDYTLMRLKEFDGLGNRSLSYSIGLENIGEISFFGTKKELYNELLHYDVDATLFGYFYRYGLIGGFISFLHVFLFLGYQFKIIIHASNNLRQIFIGILLIVTSILIHRPFVLLLSFYIFLLLTINLENKLLKTIKGNYGGVYKPQRRTVSNNST